MKRPYKRSAWLRYAVFCGLFLASLIPSQMEAQPRYKMYTVRDGNMHIELSKKLSDSAIDSFIRQYNLSNLALKEFIRKDFRDSVFKAGWKINENTRDFLIISKPFAGFENLPSPADMILFAGERPSFATLFPVESQGVVYGLNRFRNKEPFAVTDSSMIFFLRGYPNARKVILSGSFVNWSPDSLTMIETDSGWIAHINLRPGKYWYKFIIDGTWHTDNDNMLHENDDLGNVNSVVYKTNTLFRFNPPKNVKKVWLAGSFNNWDPSGSVWTVISNGRGYFILVKGDAQLAGWLKQVINKPMKIGTT